MKKNKEIHIDFQENGKDYLMHECSKAFLITFSDTSGLCTNTEPVCVCLDKKTAEKYLKLHKGFRSIQELPLVTVSAKTKRKKTKGNKDLDLNKLYEMQKENREIMEKETKNSVREWTDEDERKYRKMLATPLKKLTEQEQLELAAVSPHPPLGASKKVKSLDIDFDKLSEMQRENRKIMENLKQVTETPMFSQSSEDIAKTLSDAGIKTAEANHKFNMIEIKAKMLADLCNNIIAYVPHSVNPQHPEFVTDYANKLVEQTVGKL